MRYRRLHALLSFSHGMALSAELKIFASRAILTVLTEVGPQFEKSSGQRGANSSVRGPLADFT